MSKIINCAVVGLGRIGYQYHIPQLLANGSFKVVAVVDPIESRVHEVQAEFGIEYGYTECKFLAERDDINLVIIASPTKFHREQTELFLKSNMDVFCDKPVALSSADAISMHETAQRYNRKLMVYQPHRLWAKTAKDIIDSGKLGRIFRIERKVMNFVCRNDWQSILAQGGGMLLNYGAHFIDSLLYSTGEKKVKNIDCQLYKILSVGDAEDVVICQFQGESSISYSLEINMASALKNSEFIIYGDKGSARLLPNRDWELRYIDELPTKNLDDSLAAKNRKYIIDDLDFKEETVTFETEDFGEYYRLCYDFYALNAPPVVPMEETTYLMKIIEMSRNSNQKKGECYV